MSNGLAVAVMIGLALLIVVGGAMFLLLDEVDPQEKVVENGDHLRQVAVTSLASSINHYGSQQLTDSIGPDWVHLGTSQGSCPLETAHCHLSDSPCLNLPELMGQGISLPVDQKADDGMTGYVVRAISQDMVEIKACYTQADEPIVQRVKVKTSQAATESAEQMNLVNNTVH